MPDRLCVLSIHLQSMSPLKLLGSFDVDIASAYIANAIAIASVLASASRQ